MNDKKILMLAEINNQIDYSQFNSVIDSFKKTSYHVELSLTTNYKTDFNYIHYKDIDVSIYDIIICFKVRNLTVKHKDIPVILITDIDSEIKSFSILKHMNKFDYVFLINDGLQYPILKFYPKQLFQKICLFAMNKSVNSKPIKNDKFKIFIDINVSDIRMSPIFDVISVVNQYYHIDVDVKSKQVIKSFFNQKVKLIVEDSDVDFNDYDLVIANKHSAYNAILNQIPCIVVGENGYAGVIDENNLKSLFNINFNGRDGGYIAEAIPVKLMTEAISISFRKQKPISDIKRMLSKLQIKELNKIINVVDHIINSSNVKKPNLLNTTLILNKAYTIVLINEHKWNIIDQFSKLVFSMGKEEYSLFSKFRKAANVSKVVQKSIYKDDIDIPIEFITELVKNKILISYEKQL